MKLLLDTHVMFWWLRDGPQLGEQTRRLIATPQAQLLVSVASFWEFSVKARLGKAPELGSQLMRAAQAGGLDILGIDAEHLSEMETIALRGDHKDPFDLLILAQARVEQATLVTRDAKLLAYDVHSHRVR
jgi:PIN domain nuclease of toxin-antitoxin system